VVLLEDLGSLDTLPCGGDLDQDTFLWNADGLVKLYTLLANLLPRPLQLVTYVNDVKGFFDRLLGVERVAGVNLSRDTSWDNLQNLLAKLDQQAVKRSVDLLIETTFAVLLGVLDGVVHQLGILCLLGGSEDERRVGGGILWLVLSDG
jgi:hypothetical protein